MNDNLRQPKYPAAPAAAARDLAFGSLAAAAGRAWIYGLIGGAQVAAWVDGLRPKALAADALSHRIGLTWRAAAEGRTARGLIGGLVERVRAL